jgi:type I restriction enzyme, S subunit
MTIGGRPETTSVIPGQVVLSVGWTEMPAPPNWVWTKLTDITRLETGHTPSREHPEYWDGDIPWIGIKDARLSHGTLIQDTFQKVTQLGLDNSAARLLPAGTVCLSRTASVGYALILAREMATSQDFVSWVCSPALVPKFLMYALLAEKDSLHRFGKGTTHTTIYVPEVKAFHICLPPVEEQRRIVERLEELLSDLDAGVSALARAWANLKKYRAAVLKAAVNGELTAQWRAAHPDVEPATKLLDRILAERERKWAADQKAKFSASGKPPPKNWQEKYPEPLTPDTTRLPQIPPSWCWATLPQLGLLDRGRSRHRPRNAQHLYGGPYPFIQTGDVGRARGVIREYAQTYSEAGLQQSRLWPEGTLCITIAANIAETAILGFPACFPDSVVGFIPHTDETSVPYIHYVFETIQKELEHYAPATAQKNINLDALQQVAVPLPPKAEQLVMVEEVERQLSGIAATEDYIDAGLKRAARLRRSVLNEAFAGRLVPQSPADEPASVLLDRICHTRTADGSASVRHSRSRKGSDRIRP